MEVSDDLEPIAVNAGDGKLTARDILSGKKFDPITQVRMYSDKEYEIFISEWATSCLLGKYRRIARSKGKGDKGRDVVGFYDESQGSRWDNYQCKHYGSPLAPSDIWLEIGKLIFYTHRKDYSVPEKYYFVAPQGIGNMLLDILEDPAQLKAGIKAAWEKNCEASITKKKVVKLDGDLLDYLEKFNFSIFSYLDPQSVINDHAKSIWHAMRFGGGLRPRPRPATPPSSHEQNELLYTSELQRAYSERDGKNLSFEEIGKHPNHADHFSRQRKSFYHAESLRQFAKDTLPNNGDFESLQEQIHDGVAEVLDSDHKDSLERVNKTLAQAKAVAVSHILSSELTPSDKGGICHQLVNDKKIKWGKNEK